MVSPLLLGILGFFKKTDRSIFVAINRDMANPFFDAVLPFFRNAPVWAPLYLFLIVFALLNFKKTGGWWILFFICTVALTDMIGNYGFKHNFERLRPCNNPEMQEQLRLLVKHCSSSYSFTSNHAANHFGMAGFIYFTLKNIFPKWAWLGLVWAGIICFAQVYVGVHYPSDVAGGAVLGLVIGCVTASFFNKRHKFTTFATQQL